MSNEPVIASPIEAEIPVIASPEEVKSKELASNFERLTKQEKFNSESRRVLEEKRKAFESDKAELERYRNFDKELKLDPLAVLEKLGLPLSRIQQLANDKHSPQNAEARHALDSVRRLENELKMRDDKSQEERLSREEVKLTASIAETIKSEGYDLIEHLGAEHSVKEFMEQYYEETGEIPDIKMACEAVANDIAAKLLKVKDSKWMNKPKVEVKEELKQDAQRDVSAPKTISNKMSQTVDKVSRGMTDAERLKEATRILSGM